jgi:hypothetical protein
MRSHLTLRVGICECTNRYVSALPDWQGQLWRLRDRELSRPLIIGFRTSRTLRGGYTRWINSLRATRCHFEIDIHHPLPFPHEGEWETNLLLLDFRSCRWPRERMHLGGIDHSRRASLQRRSPLSTEEIVRQMVSILQTFTHDQLWQWHERIQTRTAA